MFVFGRWNFVGCVFKTNRQNQLTDIQKGKTWPWQPHNPTTCALSTAARRHLFSNKTEAAYRQNVGAMSDAATVITLAEPEDSGFVVVG